MLKSGLVLQSHSCSQRFFFIVGGIADDLSDIVGDFTVDPSSTEEARAFTFHLADNLAAVDAVVDEWVLSGLTIADLTRSQFNLGKISYSSLLCCSLLLVLRNLGCFISPDLDLLSLLLVSLLSLDPLYELVDESFDILPSEIKQV